MIGANGDGGVQTFRAETDGSACIPPPNLAELAGCRDAGGDRLPLAPARLNLRRSATIDLVIRCETEILTWRVMPVDQECVTFVDHVEALCRYSHRSTS